MQNELVEEPPRVEPPADLGQTTNRRGALKALAAASGAIYAGALIVPVTRMLAPSSNGEAGKARWIRVGRLADVKPDEPKRVVVIADERDAYTVTRDQLLGSLWLVRKGDQVTALSAVCPHLGCSIDLNADKQSYACPCHVSKFSLAGEALSGPSPRAMDPLQVRVVDGFVEVDFRRFRQGIPTKEEVG
ncbi:MAG: Rieske 2Fe-2S domain-containing protein [Polyangiaceae bacterium]|nr:Rieske 2Fe-2S domain-containing protein [Polyangiaceae bacterium]